MSTEINLTPTCSYFELATHDNVISGRTWGTLAECHTQVLLVHGLGAHSGWFETLGRRLKVKRVFAVAYDQKGFGKRQNEKVLSYNEWIDDLAYVYHHLEKQSPDKPIVLVGNSMGAVVALSAACDLNPHGLILCSPGFEGHKKTFGLGFKIAGIVKALAAPQSLVSLPYDTKQVSRNQASRKFMDSDPLRRFRLPASILFEVLKLTNYASKQVPQLACPTLMLTAGVDHIVSNDVNADTFDRIGTENKKRRHFKEAYHDLMFDPEIDEVANEITTWIKPLTKKAAPLSG